MTPIHKFVINLADRTDRRREMEAQLRRVGWEAIFQPATRPDTADGFPSVGARGCFLSHLATLNRGLGTRGHVLIMEDDLSFVKDFPRLWNAAIEDLETKNWSIFYAGHTLTTEHESLSILPPSQGILCSHFVLIHADAMQTIVDGLSAILSRPPGHPDGGPMHAGNPGEENFRRS
jgi:GR25 family glycosyltransferase involved in LPS biosynthesis